MSDFENKSPAEAGKVWTDNINKLLENNTQLEQTKLILKQLIAKNDFLQSEVHSDMINARMDKATFNGHDLKRGKAYFGEYKTLKNQIFDPPQNDGVIQLVSKHTSKAILKSAVVISLPPDNDEHNKKFIADLKEFIKSNEASVDCDVLSEINPQTLKKFLKLWLEDEDKSIEEKQEIVDFFKVRVKPTVKISTKKE